MKKVSKILLFVAIIAFALLFKARSTQASTYIWPVGGNNANETYKDYDFYGKANTAPYKNGKSGREYKVDNNLWPNEKYFYASCESHYGMDITGINGHDYTIVSVCDGVVIATSGTRAKNPGVNYIDRNQRRTSAGLNDGGGYGNYIVIEEPSTGKCFLYAHLRGGSLVVNKGDSVCAGQAIATMGSSGDSGHMHLHIEIRKDKASTIKENNNGTHYLATTNTNTNLDPEQYIGSEPNVYIPFEDSKSVKISKDDAKLYARYLYRAALGREAGEDEAEFWGNKYIETESIYYVTSGIVNSEESINKNGVLTNIDYLKKMYDIVLCKNGNYNNSELYEYLDKLDRGRMNRDDFLKSICNSPEFVNEKCNYMISIIKNEDIKKAEEEAKIRAEEEAKQKEEEEKKKKEEEEARIREEEEKKKQEEENVKLYVRYLYRKVLGRNPMVSEINHWLEQYKQNKDIPALTKGIFVNVETESMTNYDFMKKITEVLYNRDDVQAKVIEAYAGAIDRGEITRADFIVGVCSTQNFKENMYQTLVNIQKEYEKDKKYIAIAPKSYLSKLGDLDGDGTITLIDATLCLSLANLEDKSDYSYAISFADVDGDGLVEYDDAQNILNYYMGIVVQAVDSSMTIEQYMQLGK